MFRYDLLCLHLTVDKCDGYFSVKIINAFLNIIVHLNVFKNFNFLWQWHLLPQSFVAFLEFIHHKSTISSETLRCENVMIIFEFS